MNISDLMDKIKKLRDSPDSRIIMPTVVGPEYQYIVDAVLWLLEEKGKEKTK